ncbi:unnamed protein product [Arabidopsis thaliana]|uniref:Uncharacterized protein n=1 Tax=Arabidopsis thaliana TaxID=3702 RepID=A0A654FPY9_ARATH|nr:unnamed protein product [Arabidopsis thaliana]
MDIPKQYLSLFILIIFITTKLSQADHKNDISVPNDSSSTNSVFPSSKRTVEINNDLGNQLTLLYHCKSKDDDLGNRSLQPVLVGQMNRIRSIYIKTIEIAAVITSARATGVCGR